ncbi:MAG: TRAP transporter large permease subunit [Deltaproteobacteria bacterium]|nr:TRAP transporter large permease subunit [Deltaproteobacteria bacterium]
MILVLVIILIMLALMGMPIFACILGAAMLGLYSEGINLVAIPIDILRLSSSPILMSIPLFTFAGYLLAEGETSHRLIRFSKSLLGWIPGGLGVVALVSCAFFTAVTGATGITIIALGGLLFPSLIKENYKENFSLGLVTTGGSLGLNFPPSLPVILYGYVSGVNIDELFMAGLLPGLLMLGMLCGFSIYTGKKWKIKTTAFRISELVSAFRGAIWELPIPFLIIAGIYSGFCTATEAASVIVVYVLIIKTIVYKEINIIKDLPGIMIESMKMVGGILIILGAALGFTNYLVDAFVPVTILEFMKSVVHTRIGFLLILNFFLIIVGCMMDIFSAILIVVPLIIPLADSFGIDPLHLGIIFLVNLAIGYNTPPVGINLFIASARLERPVIQLYKATLPFLFICILSLLIISYWPWLSLYLPGVLR